MKNDKKAGVASFLILLIVTSCSSMTPKFRLDSQNTTDSPLIKEYLSVGRRLSAIPLWFYHYRVSSFRFCEMSTESNEQHRQSNCLLDSVQYKQSLLCYSTQIDSGDSICIEGVMRVDSIIYGYNVYRIDVTFDSNKYYIFSIPSRVRRNDKEIFQGNSYYMKIKPYFYQDSNSDFHNRGLYIKGYVVRDYDLEYFEWKKVCTSNSISGLTYCK